MGGWVEGRKEGTNERGKGVKERREEGRKEGRKEGTSTATSAALAGQWRR